MSFKIVDRTGFEIKLDNGWTVAARFGPTAYCGNNTSLNGGKGQLEVNLQGESWEGANVEVRAFTNNKEYIFQQTGKPYKGWHEVLVSNQERQYDRTGSRSQGLAQSR